MRWPWRKHADKYERRAQEQAAMAEQRMREAQVRHALAEAHKARALRFVAENHISPKLESLYRGRRA